MILEVKDLVCGYRADTPVIGPLSFSIQRGEVVCFIGPNGVGKTTLFKTVLGILKPLAGTITLNGQDTHSFHVKEFSRHAAYVPQSHIPAFPYSVRDVVVMGRNPNMGELSSPCKDDFQLTDKLLEKMGIAHLAAQNYTEISGGERQMVLITRALAQQAELLVMDEPTSQLDYGNEALVLGCIKRLAKQNYTIIMITHEPNHAFLCADKVVAVGEGGFCVIGTPDSALTEESLHTLYGVKVQVLETWLCRDSRYVKFCIPQAV